MNRSRRAFPVAATARFDKLHDVAKVVLTRSKGSSSREARGLIITEELAKVRLRGGRAQAFGVYAAVWRGGSTLRFKAPETKEKEKTKRAPKLPTVTA